MLGAGDLLEAMLPHLGGQLEGAGSVRGHQRVSEGHRGNIYLIKGYPLSILNLRKTRLSN